MGFSGMPDIVVWSKNTLDIALWVKSKIAAICTRLNNESMSFLAAEKQIRHFSVNHSVHGHARHSDGGGR